MNIIVIGAGHNGLAAAFYLAKAGLKPLVLERSDTVGGGAITTELHPGFKCPTLAHHTPLWNEIVGDMRLAEHRVEWLAAPVDVLAPSSTGPPLVIHRNTQETVTGLRDVSAKDASAYANYRAALDSVCSVMSSILMRPAPDIEDPNAGDVWHLLTIGRRFRSLGRKNAYRLLRWVPMAVSDLAEEWFESDVLRSVIAANGISGTVLGPRSAGSGLVHLLNETNRRLAGHSLRARGGPGALTHGMAAAATAAGATVRVRTRVERILIREGKVAGVVADGQETPASIVVSAIDPKTTFLDLVDPAELSSQFLMTMRNFRATGTVAKINLALSGLPAFDSPPHLLSGRIHLGPGIDYLERAFDDMKYGQASAEPWLELTIPSILDPALAPPGAHVMSIYAHFAPFQLRGTEWAAMKSTLLERAIRVLSRYASDVSRLIVSADVITPQDLAARCGFHGGHVFHGELALDQLFMMRPALGYGRYQSPVRGLFMCSAGTHPGGFMSGANGKLAAREIIRALRSTR